MKKCLTLYCKTKTFKNSFISFFSMKEQENAANENCPLCHQKTLMLAEHETEVPYFGKIFFAVCRMSLYFSRLSAGGNGLMFMPP